MIVSDGSEDASYEERRMTKLTQDQIDFLRNHRIPLSNVYDATGMSRKQCQEEMKKLGMLFAIGVTP